MRRVVTSSLIAAAIVLYPFASAALHPSLLRPSTTTYLGARIVASPWDECGRRNEGVRTCFLNSHCRSRNAGGLSSSSASSFEDGEEDANKTGDEADGNPVEELVDVPMPKYDERSVARDVFRSSLYFYHGSERLRQRFANKTEALGGITIGALRRRCYREGKLVEDVLRETYGVLMTFDFFAWGDVATLSRVKYVALNAHHEIQAYRDFRRRQGMDLYTNRLPAFWHVYQRGSDQPHDYMSPVCYVLGPHRSGKTFFALDFLKGFLNGGLPEVVLYVQPAEIPDLAYDQMENGGEYRYARLLVNWIKRGLEEELQRKLYMRLPMYVCIVLDNAGDHRLNGALMDRDAARTIGTIAKQGIAERVVIVVAGTGLITDSIQEGRGGAYHFRMKPLERDDLDRMIRRRFYEEGMMWNKFDGGIPSKDPQKEALAIAGSIEAQPALKALAQNTEMAFNLVEAILKTILLPEARYKGRYLAEYWSAQLGASAAGLLRDALREHIESSSMLASLNPTQRRRVAIWTLWRLNSMKEWFEPYRYSRRWFQYPEFPGLNDRERDVAMAMVEINTVQYRGGFRQLRWEKHVATIVPANLLVLFYLVGVPTSVLTGWATYDVGTALYAILQWILKKVQVHHDEALRPLQKSFCPEFDFESEEATLKDFESDLAKTGEDAVGEYRCAVHKHEISLESSLREVPLRMLPSWELQAEGGRIRLPTASHESILVFAGGGGDLPDVVAPYLFLRAVRGAGDTEIVVDLESELRRCCLLRDCEDGRLLRGFLATWNGTMFDEESEDEFLIDPNGRVVGNTKLRLPKAVPERGRVRFVLTTRAEAIRVALPTGQLLKVEEKVLDSGRLLDVERASRFRWLDPDTAAAWTAFLHERVLPRVQVQFLFLKSGISPLDATSTRQRCHDR